jgi:photosystem II stability/assembly factor-like uncharacterized protein
MKKLFIVLSVLLIPVTSYGKESWSRVFDLEGQDNQIISFFALNENYAWFIGVTSNGGNSELKGYRTTNGNSFTTMTMPQAEGQMSIIMFMSIAFIDENTGYLSGFKFENFVNTNVIWKTTNGGSTWEVFEEGIDQTIMKLHVFPTGELFGISDEKFYYSNGTGFTEGNVPAMGDKSLNVLHMITPLIGYIAGGEGAEDGSYFRNGFVYKTVDGGITWTIISENLPYNLTSLFFITEEQGWIGGNDSSGPKIFITADGGSSWIEQNLPEHPAIEVEMPFVGTQTVGPTSINYLSKIKFFDCSRGVALGLACESNCYPPEGSDDKPTYFTLFLRTDDAGATWKIDEHYELAMNNWGQLMPETKILSGLNQMAFTSPNHGFIGGQHIMVLKYDAAVPETEPPVVITDCSGGTTNNGNTNNGTGDDIFDSSSSDGCGCNTVGKSSENTHIFLILILLGSLLILRRTF